MDQNETKPKIARSGPYAMEMEPGTYWWCSCGLSAKQPFCEGAHKGTEFKPVKFDVAEKKIVAWCGCKATKADCVCDGSHSKL